MCKWGDTVPVRLKIEAQHSKTGKERYDYVHIDRCIAPMVEKLQKAGLEPVASCCGHNRAMGDILLKSGKVLIICHDADSWLWINKRTKFLTCLLFRHLKRHLKHNIMIFKDHWGWRIKNIKWKPREDEI